MRTSSKGEAGTVPPPDVRAELEVILASNSFRQAERLRRMLRYTVERTLEGEGGRLKEYVLGVEVFDRGESFDPCGEAVVRVEASRLRAKLREYYDSEGDKDRVIIQLPKGGYAAAFRYRDQTASGPDPRPRKRWAIFGLAAALAALAPAGWYLSRPHSSARAGTIAVLPFDDLSSDPENEYFCAGLVEEVTTALAKIKGVRVLARSTASQVKRAKSLPVAARELGITMFLEGSVRRSKDRVRIAAQLIRAGDQSHLWSEVYERGSGDVLSVHDEIARAVARALEVQLFPERSRPADPEALDLYWRGRYSRKQPGEEGLKKSVGYYRQALEKDPQYAPAHAALAEAYGTMAFHELGPPDEFIEKAKASARQALALDGSLAEPHALLAWIGFFRDWNWPEAERGFRRAVQLNPSYAKAHTWFALGLISRGRVQEAITESRTAQELDPLSYATASDLGVILYCARRFEESAQWARKTLASDPKSAPARVLIGLCHANQGRYQEAIAEYREALEGSERYSYILGRLGYACGRAGQVEEARRLIREIEQAAGAEPRYQLHIAMIHAGLNETDRAIEKLEKSYQRREADLNFLMVEPAFDSLQPDPRFQGLLKRIGLK
ncbi:MAG: tetratricopeptide repeat protein [Candidatus Solibacter usitatus]|nr:tetratricopeptide repeat protein [Candidatus Solibacter usitatus]